jgi:hypothetical protein
MPNINNADWGPTQMLIVPDQVLSQEEVSVGLGLDRVAVDGFVAVTEPRTVSSFMHKLLQILETQPALKGVTLTQDYPQDIEQSPLVVWSLEGREAGIDSRNRKTPSLVETWPTDDGRIIEKWLQPQSFQISFECLATNPDEAERIKNFIEFYLVRNPYVIAQAGARQFFFNSEGSHGKYVAGGAAQPLDKRTLHYWGAMDVVYINEIGRLAEVHIVNATDNVALKTVEITRASDGSMADVFPLPGPIVIVCFQDTEDRVSVDYLPKTDFTLVTDRAKYGSRFWVNWVSQGRNPLPGSTYYASYIPVTGAQVNVRDQFQGTTDPGLEVQVPAKVKRRGLVVGRSAVAPRVLGQEIDSTDPQRGMPIIFTQDEDTLETPGLSPNVLDALSRASIQVVAVLDPSRIPGLAPGSAFSPPGTS